MSTTTTTKHEKAVSAYEQVWKNADSKLASLDKDVAAIRVQLAASATKHQQLAQDRAQAAAMRQSLLDSLPALNDALQLAIMDVELSEDTAREQEKRENLAELEKQKQDILARIQALEEQESQAEASRVEWEKEDSAHVATLQENLHKLQKMRDDVQAIRDKEFGNHGKTVEDHRVEQVRQAQAKVEEYQAKLDRAKVLLQEQQALISEDLAPWTDRARAIEEMYGHVEDSVNTASLKEWRAIVDNLISHIKEIDGVTSVTDDRKQIGISVVDLLDAKLLHLKFIFSYGTPESYAARGYDVSQIPTNLQNYVAYRAALDKKIAQFEAADKRSQIHNRLIAANREHGNAG